MTYYYIEDGERYEIPDLARLAEDIAWRGAVQPREVVRQCSSWCGPVAVYPDCPNCRGTGYVDALRDLEDAIDAAEEHRATYGSGP